MGAELKNTLLSSLPPGVSAQLAPDVVEHFGAVAATMQHGVDAVDGIAANATPLTAGSERLGDWERALGIAQSRTALFGSLEQRRAAVISRLREYGTVTTAMLQAVLAPLLDYSDPSTLTILEPSRTGVRNANEYLGLVYNASMSLVSPGVWQFWVADGGRCAGVPALDITLTTTGDTNDIVVALQSPDGTYYQVFDKLRGAAASTTYRLYFPSAKVTSIMGLWRVYVYLSGATTGTFDGARLFVEGVDRDGGKASGLYEWAAVYEPLKSNSSPDFPAALAAANRVGMATRRGGIVHIADAGVGLAVGDYAMIPNDNAVPSEFVPGG